MEFRVLGPLEARSGVRQLPVGGPRQRALLTILLLRANESVPRSVLVAELWGERAPRGALHSLETYVHRLRRSLADGGEPRLETRDGGYRLRVEPGELDLERFLRLLESGRDALAHGAAAAALEQLEEALAEWRGEPLAGLEDEPFAPLEIDRLEELRLAAIEDRVEAALALARHGALVPELRALVERHPLRERLLGHLMLALYRSGRQAEALGAYRAARARLAGDLGLEPGASLRALEQDILRQAPSLDLAPRPGRAVPVPRGRRRRPVVAGGVAVALVAGGILTAAFVVDRDPPNGVRPVGDALVRLANGTVAASVPLTAAPTGVAVGAGSAWVTHADAGTVDRVDARAAVVRQTIDVGSGPLVPAFGDGSVWVPNSLEGTLSRIDPATNAVVQTIRVGRAPGAAVVARHTVWVANAGGPSLSRVDASSGRVLGTVALRSPPTALAAGAGALWVTSDAGQSLSRVDPSSDSVVATIPVGDGPDAVAVGWGSVWVANNLDGTVSRIDPERAAVVSTIQVGGSPSTLAPSGEGIWVGGEFGGLTLVDPRTDAVVRRLRLADSGGVAAAGGAVWAGVHGASGHRGGRLTLLNPAPAIESLDPGILYSLFPTQLLGLTNDGLVTFKHVGGGGGTQIVPDLATALPQPADNGLTYRFRLRRGIRYSTGVPVRASDLRRGLERLYALGSPGAGFYDAIVGAGACSARPERCDLRRGVVTDDRAGTVLVRLSHPDPELLYELALPFAFAVPPGTPRHDVGRRPLPATGPYMIASYEPGHSLRLVRNPRFREWSQAAQPDGHPDEIVWRLGVAPGAGVTAIEHGRADWMLATGPPPAARRRELRTRYAAQLHVHPLLASDYFVFNVHTPPFDDLRVRRAVNLALDRRSIVRLYGGAAAARPTCQILPPQMPGYLPYCPYTRGPDDGRWHAPDLARARRLVAASGTAGMRVTVWNTPDPGVWRDEGTEVVRTLRRLGYRARYGFVPSASWARVSGDSRRQLQIASGGWGADYPAASDFISLKLSCRSFRAASEHNQNSGGFCDPALDRLIDEARRLQLAHPAAANELWARLDHRLTDDAVWLPLVNPETTDFVSRRVGNYRYHPLWGLLVDQLWVR